MNRINKIRFLHNFFQESVTKYPENIAIVDKFRKYTYTELGQLVELICQKLITNKVGKRSFVGILVDRSAFSIASELAVLKLGLAFVPLNRSLPNSKLQRIIQSSDISVVLSNQCEENQNIRLHGVKNIKIDITERAKNDKPSIYRHNAISPEDIAYCIFTSGSTGEPKGALLRHLGVVQSIINYTKAYYIQNESHVLQFANLSYDASLSEIYCAFYAGATLFIPDDKTIHDFNTLSLYLLKNKINIAILPPSIIRHLSIRAIKSLSVLVSAGEICTVSLAKRICSLVPHFINAYGPTEASIGATAYEVTDCNRQETVSIGKALGGYKLYVLDNNMKKVSYNHQGELYIGGIGVFAGYLNDIDRTNEVLIKNPFGKGYIYKTGDVVTRDNEGLYYYIGRSDYQMKINGIRISPEEIENDISKVPHVLLSTVIDGALSDKDKHYLVCFYTSKINISKKDFKDSLRESLPLFAMPRRFIRLSHMPLTANGKINRDELKSIYKVKFLRDKLSSPLVDNEIIHSWKKAFGIIAVEASDDFFDLGGTSLQAMHIISFLNKKYSTNIDINFVFDNSKADQFISAYQEEVNNAKKIIINRQENNFAVTEQERLFWTTDYASLRPESYTLTEVFKISGKLNIPKIRESYKQILSLHQSLNMSYFLSNRDIRKKYYSGNKEGYHYLDLHRINKDAKNAIKSIASTPLNLSDDPLFQVYLIRISDNKYYLVFHMHHIIADAETVNILVDDFWNIYMNKDVPCKETNKYNIPQKEYARSKSFWKKYLTDFHPFIRLPLKYSDSETKDMLGECVELHLNDKLLIKCIALSSKYRVTPFAFFRSIFMLLLHRLSNEDLITVGTAVSLRDKLLMNNGIGVFLNSIPVNSRLDNKITLINFIKNHDIEFKKCYKNRILPLHDINKAIYIADETRTANSLFNIMYDYISNSSSQIKIDGMEMHRHRAYPDTSLFDLTLTVHEQGDSYKFVWEFNHEKFSKKDILKFMEFYSTICQQAVEDISRNASSVNLYSDSEIKLINNKFDDGNTSYPNKCYINAFENSCINYPDKIAVSHEEIKISYKDLNKRADMIACILLEHGIKPGDTIGVYMKRGINLVVSILSIWKVRAVYMPLEPDFPQDRLSYMCKKSNMKFVIFDNNLLLKGANFISIKFDDVKIIHNENYSHYLKKLKMLSSQRKLSDQAYIIFTSGSTGNPKGAIIRQLGMMNHCLEMIRFFDIDSKSRLAQTASHCFDISIWQMTVPLMVGGKIIIYSKNDQLDVLSFLDKLIDDKITLAELVPSYLKELLENVEFTRTKLRMNCKLRSMIVTGETVTPDIIEKWYNLFPEVSLVNAYGPAEASDDTNLYIIPSNKNFMSSTVPVGKPIGNVKIYILDRFMNPCSIGIRGEIYVSGISVGCGYVNDPKKTKEAFLVDLFSQNGESMYKTGDIGSWNADGTVNFHGRIDFQVKVSGHRIELEEVENNLNKLNIIKQSAVIAKNINNRNMLVAFVSSDKKIDVQSIKKSLEKKLPAYMIPKNIIQIHSIPLNNSGKIDRKKLSNIDPSDSAENLNYCSSYTKEEKILKNIWSDVFGAKSFSCNDNFFSIGGDSLTCIMIVSRLLSHGYNISMEDIYSHPTIGSLSTVLSKRKNTIHSKKITKFLLSPVQKIFLEHYKDNANWYNQNIILKCKNTSPDKVRKAIVDTIKQHDIFLTRLSKDREGIRPKYITADKFNQNIKEISCSDSDTALNRMLKLNCAIDIYKGPIVAYSISNKKNITEVLIAAHHFIIDALSWDIFISDLEKSHNSTYKDHANTISTSNFWEWVDYNYQHLAKQNYSDLSTAWMKNLEAPILLSDVFGHKHFYKQPKHFRKIIKYQPDKKYSERIISFFHKNRSLKIENTLFAVTLKSLSIFLDKNKFSFMFERHGREDMPDRTNISRTIGWFTTIHPVLFHNTHNSIISLSHEIDKTFKKLPTWNSYGYLKYNDYLNTPVKYQDMAEPDIILNYLGQSVSNNNENDKQFTYSLAQNHAVDPSLHPEFALEIDISLSNDNIYIELVYDPSKIPEVEIKKYINCIHSTFINLVEEILLFNKNNLTLKNTSIEKKRVSEIIIRLKKNSQYGQK